MSINFSDTTVQDFVPDSLLDENLLKLCMAMQPQFNDITSLIMGTLFLPNLDKLTGNILEHLAWWFNLSIDVSWTLATTDKQKQELIANAIEIHRYKGTLYGLKQSLSVIGVIVNIEEWFEYGGEPYNFRINIDGTKKYTPEQLIQLDYYINRTKNVRSHVTGKIFSFDVACNVNYASAIIQDEVIELYPK